MFLVNLRRILFDKVKKMKGTVKWYNARKGFGFITGEDEKDVFVHRSAIPNGTYINDGDKVEYEIEESERGPQATKIKKL
jgi:CspA family cold shock protein